MGSGSSTNLPGLHPHQVAEFNRLVKQEYERSIGCDEERRRQVIAKYGEIMNEALNMAATPTSAASHVPKRPSSSETKPKEEGESTKTRSKSQGVVQPAPVRRKSFAGKAPKPLADVIVVSTDAMPNVEPEKPNEDSWDSVTESPYCAVCGMGFKSAAQLARHVKFSDLHAKEVAKLAGGDGIKEEVKVAEEPKDLVEGVHYKMIYSGSKLFWKSGTTVEFCVFIHIASAVVEIIGFNTDLGKNTNRLYMDYNKLLLGIEPALLENLKKKRTELEGDKRFTMQNVSEEALKEETNHVALASFIVSRLQLNEQGGDVEYVPFTFDSPDLKPIIECPAAVHPITYNWRRRSSSEDISRAIAQLNLEADSLKAATAEVEQVEKNADKAIIKLSEEVHEIASVGIAGALSHN